MAVLQVVYVWDSGKIPNDLVQCLATCVCLTKNGLLDQVGGAENDDTGEPRSRMGPI